MSTVANIFRIPELRRRILFTLGMLAVYRIGIFVTTPGVDRSAMRKYVAGQSGGFLSMFNLFSGGALEQASIFALNIMPYVSASIILSLMTVVVPSLMELRKEGEAGQRKINQYTRYGTVGLSIFQSMGLAMLWEGWNESSTAGDIVADPGWSFRLMTVLALTTGTSFLMWLGEQITERGLGNGISLIIFAGIVANLPDALFMTLEQFKLGELQPIDLMLLIVIALGTTAFHRLLRARSEAPADHLRQAHDRTKDVRRAAVSSSAPREHGRRHSADLHVVLADVPRHLGGHQHPVSFGCDALDQQ